MQVNLLGALEVRDDDGTPIEITGARLRTLLIRLALDAGRPVAATALIDAIWGDDPPATAANSLQTLVSRLRRALGDAAFIAQSPAGYRLDISPDDVDAHRFDVLAADGARALRAGDPVAAAGLLRDALALWRGPALVDAPDSLRTVVDRLGEQRVTAVLDRVAADIALGQAETAVPELDAMAAELPLDERVAGQLITALAQSGRQAEALHAYERIRDRLADDLGVDPSAELQAVHVAVLRGELGGAAAPPPTQARRRTNLSAPLTSFVGRDAEVARVGQTLREHRLVTLVGPGGAGKTRLAAEAGAHLDVPDGVWLAELAPITDPAGIAQAVLNGLGFRETQLIERRPLRAHDATARLTEVLSDKTTVVVLDNCEHLIEASARLAEHLLQQCPHLRVLATSREPLGLIGEAVLALPPLRQPDPNATAAEAIAFPAVRLFADRASAARPDFAVDDTTVATVIDIVRRLDGLPLAIELAAARLRTLPLTDIANRLSDRFRLLTGGSRTALPRHRTLRAVVEWSWELLTKPEQVLAERLAVFPAGVVVESAEAVCADEMVPAEDVPELLDSLIDKSLLQRVGERMRMLETIREFGVEQLSDRGELAEVRRRHADYFARLVADAEPHLIEAGQVPWIKRLGAERENIVAALRFRCGTGDSDGALTMAVSYASYAMLMGEHSDVTAWLGEALAVPGGGDTDVRIIARAQYAMNATATGMDADEVDHGLDELHAVAAELDRINVDAHPMNGMLRVAITFFVEDRDLMNQIVAEELASDHPWRRAAARMFRANLAENDGDIEGMRDDIEIAADEFRAIGERWGLANTLRSLALLRTLDGELGAAERLYDEAMDLMAELQSSDDEAFFLIRLAEVAGRQGDTARSRELMERALVVAEQKSGIESVFVASMMADSLRRDGDTERARAVHEDALERVSNLPPAHPAQAHGRAIVYAIGARFAFIDGDVDRARQLAADAYAAAVTTKDLPITAAIGIVLAELTAELGHGERAAEMLGAAARLRGSDDPTSVDIARLTTLLRAELGDDRFDVAYARGKDLDRTAALQRLDPAEALSD